MAHSTKRSRPPAAEGSISSLAGKRIAPGASPGRPARALPNTWLLGQLQAIFQTLPCALAILGPEGNVLGINPAFEELFGYANGELRGRRLPPDLAFPAAEGATDLPQALVEERWVSHRAGNPIHVAIRSHPIRPAGRELGCYLLYRDLSQRERDEAQRSRFIGQIIAAQEEERRRIARELHDETGQSLAAVLVGIMSLIDEVSETGAREKLGQLLFTTSAAIEEVRRMARGLRPSLLDDQGLKAAVEVYAVEYAQRHGIHVEVHMAGLDETSRLPPLIETTIYRVVQEALTNVARHSGAATASVIVERRDGQVCTIVEDDGCGFDPAATSAGLGLDGIRERSGLLGGTFEIESKMGRSTLYLKIPLAQP